MDPNSQECKQKMFEIGQGLAFVCGLFGGCLALIDAVNNGKIIGIGSVVLCLIGYVAVVFAIIGQNETNKLNSQRKGYSPIMSPPIDYSSPNSAVSSVRKSSNGSDSEDIENQSWNRMVDDDILPVNVLNMLNSPSKRPSFLKPSIITKEDLITIIDTTMSIKLQTDRNVKYSYKFEFKKDINLGISILQEYQFAYYIAPAPANSNDLTSSNSFTKTKLNKNEVIVSTSLHDITGPYR
jgi:hypothetical protein